MKLSFNKSLGIFLAGLLLLFWVGNCSDDSSSSSGGSDVEDVVISGQLSDNETGEPLANATVELSGSLAAAEKATVNASLVVRGTSVKTDSLGFYSMTIGGGSKVHTITITKEDGTDLGSFKVTITKTNTVSAFDASDAPSLTVSQPSVVVASKAPSAGSEINVDGTWSEVAVTMASAEGEQQMTISGFVVNQNKVVFGFLRRSVISKDAKLMTFPLAGSLLMFNCTPDTSDGLALECIAKNVTVGGENKMVVDLTASTSRVSTSTTIADGTVNTIDMTTPSNYANGILGTTSEWGTPVASVTDANGDQASGAPAGADISQIYAGYDAASSKIAFFMQMDGNVDTNYIYTLRLRNNFYSEILFIMEYSESTWKFRYRINDSGNWTDFSSGDFGINSGATGNAFEFYVDLAGTGTAFPSGTIDATKLADMEIEAATRPKDGGDASSDEAHPVSYFDFE